MRRRALASIVAVSLILAAACGGESESSDQQSPDAAATTGTRETTTAADTMTEAHRTTTSDSDDDPLAGGQSCTNERAGYTVRYPAEWHTNSGDVVARCCFFHPEPFEVEAQTEVLDIAISLRVDAVPFERVTGEGQAERTLEREETTIDGRPAVRTEAEATGAALLPDGTRVYRYAIDLDGRTVIASTLDVAGLDYAANKRLLDAMVASLELS